MGNTVINASNRFWNNNIEIIWRNRQAISNQLISTQITCQRLLSPEELLSLINGIFNSWHSVIKISIKFFGGIVKLAFLDDNKLIRKYDREKQLIIITGRLMLVKK